MLTEYDSLNITTITNFDTFLKYFIKNRKSNTLIENINQLVTLDKKKIYIIILSILISTFLMLS